MKEKKKKEKNLFFFNIKNKIHLTTDNRRGFVSLKI